MKLDLKKRVMLAVLAMLYGGVYVTSADAAKVNIVANTSGGSYRTDIALTGVKQATKNGAITMGNQINFGTYKQSSNGTIFQSSTGTNGEKIYSVSSGATFNTDPVAWIVVKDNGSNKYTLVSTKVLDGGRAWNPYAPDSGQPGRADGQNWGKMTASNTLRYYMNDTMYKMLVDGMSNAQKELIMESQITTYKVPDRTYPSSYNGWGYSTAGSYTTKDKLYLMSVEELQSWFAGQSGTNPTTSNYNGGSGKVSWGAGATDYAISKGIAMGSGTAVDGSRNAGYFLRSPSGWRTFTVRKVREDGAVYSDAAGYSYFGARPAMQVDLSSLIFTSASSYNYTADAKFTKGKGSAVLGGAAAKFDPIFAGGADNPGSVLDLTLYDSNLGTPNVTTNTTMELNDANMKLGYSGASTTYKTAGMLATGNNTDGYVPEGWALLSDKGTGDMVVGLANMDADKEYQLLMFNEQGDGTSFVGDATYAFDGFKKNNDGKFELDLTTTNNASKTFSGEVKVGDGNKLTAKAGQFTGTDDIANNGTVELKEGTLTRVINGTGDLTFAGDVSTNADNIATTGTNMVNATKTLTLIGGALTQNITNNGTLKTVGDITISSSIEGTGTLVVESGTLEYTNTTAGSITNNVEIKAGATLDPDAGVFASGTTVTNYGTLEITGGTLNATIDGKGGDNLVMKNHMTIGATGVVKQAEGSNITVEKTLIESENNDPSKAMFQGIDDADKLDVSKGNLTIEGNITKDKYYVLAEGNAVNDGTVTGATLWKLENIDFPGVFLVDYDVNATGGSIALYISSATSKEEGYTSGLAAVQQGNITAAKEFTEETEKHLGLAYREAIKDKDKYDKEVWANIIHTKEKTEGMELGEGIENNNTAQYNGTVVGTDFYTSKKAITGMALGYIDGNINSQSGRTSTKNDAKYYGVSLYNRVTNGSTALIYDVAYIRGDNDIRQHSNGQEVTADVKTDTYTAGVRYETEVELGRSKLVPFASFRYMRLNNRDYSNSNNTKFETDNQNLYIPKAGIAWTGEFIMPQSAWTWKPHVEGGYVWNLGDRSVAGDVWCGRKLANIEYDTADKGSYYVKAGMEFICKNLTAGVFYRYLKGDAVRNNRWNLNVNWSF